MGMKATRPSWAYTSVLCDTCMGDRIVVLGVSRSQAGLQGDSRNPCRYHFGREPKWLLYIDVGVRFGREPNCVRGRRCSVRARTELCARKGDFGLGENRTVCAEGGLQFGREPNCVRRRMTSVRRETTCVRGRRLFPGR